MVTHSSETKADSYHNCLPPFREETVEECRPADSADSENILFLDQERLIHHK